MQFQARYRFDMIDQIAFRGTEGLSGLDTGGRKWATVMHERTKTEQGLLFFIF